MVISSTLDSKAIASISSGLRPLGTLVLTGFTGESISIVPMAMALSQHNIVGSLIASRRDTQEVLLLAAQNKIHSVSEVFSLEDVNDAYEKLRANDVRFRTVMPPNG